MTMRGAKERLITQERQIVEMEEGQQMSSMAVGPPEGEPFLVSLNHRRAKCLP